MAYTQQKDGTIVVNGFENGIADNPFDGISDIRNVNLISIPKEASVNFATSAVNPPLVLTGTISSADAATDEITFSGASGLSLGMAIVPVGGSLPAGITSGQVYWVGQVTAGGTKTTLYSDASLSTLVNITATGTGVFPIPALQIPKYYAYSTNNGTNYLLDSIGQVWSDARASSNLNGYWVYQGNRVPGTSYTQGNGLVLYKGSGTNQFLFVIHNSSIDYIINPDSSTPSWVYQWVPSTGAVGVYSATPAKVLQSPSITTSGSIISHEALLAPDNRVYYCDLNYVGRWYQTDPAVTFVPTTPATYTFDQTPLLPFSDVAQCLTFLGTNILVGGKNNIVYPWDRFSTNPNQYILLAESNVAKMITVNTTTFIFVGNRGRIYYTNGSQAQLYKKMPDHLSGTVEPYFTWGGVTSNKNQLYFSALVTTNAGVNITTMGGLWAIDLDSKAQRMTNQLSYQTGTGAGVGTYAGYATALAPNFASNPAGTGLFIGWNSGASTYGIDATISTPYTGSQAYVDSDLIPIGTFLKPVQNSQVEYKLSAPMVAGESVSMYYRLQFTDAYTLIFTKSFSAGANNFAGNSTESTTSLNFGAAQWLQIRTVINSTASTPSYTRLKEFRIMQNG